MTITSGVRHTETHLAPWILRATAGPCILALLIGTTALPAAEKLPATIAPTKVHLRFNDTPVDKAVAELSRKTGYFIFLDDAEGKGKGKLKERKITLDTGEVPFWEAFEKLCAAGSLVEGRGVALTATTLPKLPPPPKSGEPIPLIQPGGGVMPMFQSLPGTLNLKDGTRSSDAFGVWKTVPMPAAAPADTTSAVRIQSSTQYISLNRDDAQVAASQVRGELKVTPEPNLRWQELVGVRIDRAVDEHGQTLQQVKKAAAPAPKFGSFGGGAPGTVGGGFQNPLQDDNVSFVAVRLAKGAKPSKTLKEVEGVISAKVSVFGEQLLAIEDLAKSQNKAVKGAKGGTIKAGPAKAAEQGDTQFSLELTLPAQFVSQPQPGAGISAAPLPGLRVLDAEGAPIPIISMTRSAPGEMRPGVPAQYLVRVRPAADQTPTKISYSARPVVSVDIPFVLKDVPVR